MNDMEMFNEAAKINLAACAKAEQVTGAERAYYLRIAREASEIGKDAQLRMSIVELEKALANLRRENARAAA